LIENVNYLTSGLAIWKIPILPIAFYQRRGFFPLLILDEKYTVIFKPGKVTLGRLKKPKY